MSRNRTLLRVLPVAGALAVALGVSAPGANASFSTARCAGDGIAGEGATFQGAAQTTWIAKFKITDPLTTTECGGFPNTIAYTANGSGAGRTAFGGGSSGGARSATSRYIGFDEPPSATEQAQIEAGTASATDNGDLHTVPTAVGAVAIIVNLPSGCTIPAAATDTFGRFKVSNAAVERVFAHQTTTWNALLGGAACAGNITRVVRNSDSGTTFVTKKFFERADTGAAPDIDWDASASAVPNTTWPDDTSNIIKSSGNGGVASSVSSTDGSIGYVDLATARANGFSQAGTADDKFWIRLEAPNASFVEPSTAAADSTTTGANCTSNQTVNTPTAPGGSTDETLANWTGVLATPNAASAGYPICALTYVGAWDDNADVYGTAAAEEKKARTVKDYLTYVVDSTHAGQFWLASADYAALPVAVDTIAKDGVAAIDWNKP